jgi:hypothetical protein
MHVDAAWAGMAAILPEQLHWFVGLDKVDSYSFNPYSEYSLHSCMDVVFRRIVTGTA